MRRKSRVVMARLSTPKEHGARAFDLEFWQSVSSEERAGAAWDLVKHRVEASGGDPSQLKLQRDRERLIVRVPLRRRRPKRG